LIRASSLWGFNTRTPKTPCYTCESLSDGLKRTTNVSVKTMSVRFLLSTGASVGEISCLAESRCKCNSKNYFRHLQFRKHVKNFCKPKADHFPEDADLVTCIPLLISISEQSFSGTSLSSPFASTMARISHGPSQPFSTGQSASDSRTLTIPISLRSRCRTSTSASAASTVYP